MPDDERLGGTRDPHEHGRRHRRDEQQPAEEKPKRRRRSMEGSGGVSVADLVQKHTGSRQNLTPVNPDSLVSGRRARHEDPPPNLPPQNTPPPNHPPPNHPPQSRPSAAPPGGPREESIAAALDGVAGETAQRRGGQSSYFVIPPDAIRNDVASSEGFPPDAGRHGGPTATTEFPPDAQPVRRPRPHKTRNGFPPDAEMPRPQPGEASAGPHGAFPPDPRGAGRRGGSYPAADGFPPDGEPPHRNGAGRPPAPAPDHGFPPDGFPPDSGGPRRGGGRRAAGAPALLPVDPRGGPAHRGGETSAHYNIPGPNIPGPPSENARRAGETYPPGDGPRRVGETSAYHGLPGEPPPPHGVPGEGPRRQGEPTGARRPGETAGLGDAFRRPGAGPGHQNVPDAHRHAGEAPGLPAGPPAGLADAFRRPGDPAGIPDGYRAPAPQNPAEAPRRVGETSAYHGVPGESPRRVGEASAHHNIPTFPGDGFPPEVGPRRPPDRSAITPSDLAQGRFPADVPPPPGQTSGLFPVDTPGRQGPRPLPGPADPLSSPRLTPVSPDAMRRTSGVPAVPLPPPRRDDEDLVSMTTEMEAIGEEVQKRRSIDHTLARFSAVHDEIKAEEREKKAKRRKLRPWQADDEMDRLDELDAQQSMAVAIPNLDQDHDHDYDQDHDEPARPRKKKRRWLPGKNAGKAFAIVVATLVFVSTAVAWGFKSYFESNSQNVAALDPDSASIQDAAAQLGDENFLMVGSDTRAGATAEDGVGDEKSVEGARSDTVMIAHVPKNRERVVVVSFPRDLEVNRPACEGWDPKTGQYNGVQHPAENRVKLNTAYQVGGPMCVTKLVQQLSGLAVNHFVGIDFHGFKDMVDAVEGVEVCVEEPMEDDVLGTVVAEAGTNVKLTGDQALNFVRARHVKNDDTSDYGRIIRQQRFLSSLLRKAMSSEVLLDPGKLTDFIEAFSKATFGDGIGIEQLFTLGQSMQGVAAGRVTFITIPTVGYSNKRGNEDLRVEDSNALFEAIRQDAPLPGEAPLPAPNQTPAQVQSGLKQQEPTTGPVDPKTVKIQVFNGGNDTPGIARDTADQLAEYGFEIMRVEAAPPVDTTVIKYAAGNEARAQTLQAAVPGATLLADPSMGTAIMLVIGPGFDGNVVSPTGGGPVPEVPENLSTVNAGDVSCA